ncbi:hypothetical protein [Amycolatopsis sp. NPDC050768]|uniref:hypothetical protein n=1 Tax=Amycolatopsis sp. NPDC050768 TaxID=3154839 RepID=UPI00340E7644
MRDEDSIEKKLTRLHAAWRRDVDAEPLSVSLGIVAMRRRWLSGRAPRRTR